MNTLLILKYSKQTKFLSLNFTNKYNQTLFYVGAFYQTVLEYFSVFITSAFSWEKHCKYKQVWLLQKQTTFQRIHNSIPSRTVHRVL
jgi:hypothetical protein